jgi:hypothetical protein
MPKLLDYPLHTLDKALLLADCVLSNGGNCTKESCASKLGQTVSGYFQNLLGAAVKYGLITRKHGILYTTDLYQNIRVAYTDEEKQGYLREAFLSVQLFKKLYTVYCKEALPINIFKKVLVKEFEVKQRDAAKVANIFISGAKQVCALGDDYKFDALSEAKSSNAYDTKNNEIQAQVSTDLPYTVSFKGKGIDVVLDVYDRNDLDIVELLLKKIKKELAS